LLGVDRCIVRKMHTNHASKAFGTWAFLIPGSPCDGRVFDLVELQSTLLLKSPWMMKLSGAFLFRATVSDAVI